MNLVKFHEVFKLGELLPYRDGEIVNADLVNNDGVKMAVMSFAEGCALPKHSAPGDALIFALDGRAEILDGEEKHIINAGENYSFTAGGTHSVRALTPFKMCIIIAKK